MKVYVFNEIDLNNLPVGIRSTVYERQEDLPMHFELLFPDARERAAAMAAMETYGTYIDGKGAKAYTICAAEYRS